ncbi:MAG: hypothetical protein V4574_06610 [Pseudomonadota bacterium]
MDSRLAISWLIAALAGCNESAAPIPQSVAAQTGAVEAAQQKCTQAAKRPAPHSAARLPVEKFDECIAAEANKWPIETRKAICALGRSGGADRSPVEVYMFNGQCRTDYE